MYFSDVCTSWASATYKMRNNINLIISTCYVFILSHNYLFSSSSSSSASSSSSYTSSSSISSSSVSSSSFNSLSGNYSFFTLSLHFFYSLSHYLFPSTSLFHFLISFYCQYLFIFSENFYLSPVFFSFFSTYFYLVFSFFPPCL